MCDQPLAWTHQPYFLPLLHLKLTTTVNRWLYTQLIYSLWCTTWLTYGVPFSSQVDNYCEQVVAYTANILFVVHYMVDLWCTSFSSQIDNYCEQVVMYTSNILFVVYYMVYLWCTSFSSQVDTYCEQVVMYTTNILFVAYYTIDLQCTSSSSQPDNCCERMVIHS